LHVTDHHLDLEARPPSPALDDLLAAFPDHLVWPRPDLFYGGVHAAQRRAGGTLVGHGDARRSGAAVVVDASRSAR
jgi:gamma-glutamyltranspeptidase/glutathione hydrolase